MHSLNKLFHIVTHLYRNYFKMFYWWDYEINCQTLRFKVKQKQESIYEYEIEFVNKNWYDFSVKKTW